MFQLLRSLYTHTPIRVEHWCRHPNGRGAGLKRHSTCENHAYAATQLVRKRQRANQQASGSRSPQRCRTVQSRRADARGILEAEEGGEESDFAHVFLAQGRQPAPRGRRSQAPFARHPDSARSPEPERRIANRSQLRSSSFESAAGKGLKSLFFFFFF